MTTPYKKALDDMEDLWVSIERRHKETIRRALLIADAVEAAEKRIYDLSEPNDWTASGWNDCLDKLKKIGAG